MSDLQVSAEALIDARPEVVLAILRDFDGHHRAILPPAFTNFVVEEGGTGAGTVSRFDLTLGGRTYPTRTRIDEPSPGVIVERVLGREMVTTFTVTPDTDRSQVTIETRWQPVAGISGALERLFAPRMFRNLYRDELGRLDRYAQSLATADVDPTA